MILTDTNLYTYLGKGCKLFKYNIKNSQFNYCVSITYLIKHTIKFYIFHVTIFLL